MKLNVAIVSGFTSVIIWLVVRFLLAEILFVEVDTWVLLLGYMGGMSAVIVIEYIVEEIV